MTNAGDQGRPRAKPFLKWVGGKRQLLNEIEQLVPSKYKTYHEPFLGGGALFFALDHRPARLSDQNERLIRTYTAVRDSVEDVITALADYKPTKAFFVKVRGRKIDGLSDVEVAAWLIYLNRTAYNGLYRVNSANVFNVPFGDYKNPRICDASNLRACSRALKGVHLSSEDFETAMRRATKGDFLYCDPPYVPLSATSSFTDYTRRGFTDDDQVRLRDVALEMKARGVSVLISNSNARRVIELYKDFQHVHVKARRAVNAQGTGRGPIGELLLC